MYNKDPAKWICRVCRQNIEKNDIAVIFPPRDAKQQQIRQHMDCTVSRAKGMKFKERLKGALVRSNLNETDKQSLLVYLRSI
ncbi:MAG: hypothetical protein ACXAEU_09440 [Candidatus Hodarchaeales archaeon]|jgi:hypothetical protein